MHHTSAYTASTAQAAEVDTAALTDGILTIQNGHFLPQQDLDLIYAGVASANMARARIITPSLRQITTPFLRPINAGTNFGVPQRVANLYSTPLRMKRVEEIQLNTFHGGAGAEQVWGVIGLQVQRTPQPAGNVFTMRGTSVTAAVVNAWTQVAVTWQDILPQGTYAVVGLEVQSTTAIAARLIMENQWWRPGSLSIVLVTNFNDSIFRYGNLGEWGRFNSWAMPNVEVLAGAADAAHEVYLDLVKVA